jgi:anti-sigma factor RsiW
MSTCASIDLLVTPYIDGELSGEDRRLVDDHLDRCPLCHSRVSAESAVRRLVQGRQQGLCAEPAPASLHARCAGLVARDTAGPPLARSSAAAHAPGARRAARRVRMAPLALAASLVLLVSGAFLHQATRYSSRLLAAELTADHVKCFAANRLLGTRHEAEAVESAMLSAFGWSVRLPEQFVASGLELVGSRQCLYGEGRVAHLMYHEGGRPVSIFMLPERVRTEELVEVFGHEAAIWPSNGRTFVLVTRGSRAEVEQMASFVKAALQ